MRIQCRVVAALHITFLMVATAGWAQGPTTGSIVGAVKDTTGAILPGVTVEAASPVLIEKMRVVTTDEQGLYRIVDLRPGTYTVTFSLPGFRTVRRDGVELTTGFSALINTELAVGAVEESVTVTGASPVVDIQNVRSQNVISREVLDAVPSSKTLLGLGQLAVGVRMGTTSGDNADVGGTKGEATAYLTIHGSRNADSILTIDGMWLNNMTGAKHINLNTMDVQEITLQTRNMAGEAPAGGVLLNVVPKEGGNTFNAAVNIQGSGPSLQSGNLNPELIARGLTEAPELAKMYDYGFSVGGPVARDRLWFFTAHRYWGAWESVPGNYYNLTPHTVFYTPDSSRPAIVKRFNEDHTLRMTWRVTERQKVNFSHVLQANCLCGRQMENLHSPEASVELRYQPAYQAAAAWSYAASNRLLFTVGAAKLHNGVDIRRIGDTRDDDIPITELSTGLVYGAQLAAPQALLSYGPWFTGHFTTQASASYITGSHAFKTGFFALNGRQRVDNNGTNNPVAYNVRKATPGSAPVPVSLTLTATPVIYESEALDLGIYAQDQWTRRRLTLNLAVRFDYFNGHVPAQTRPAGMFTPAMSFDAVSDVPNWRDVSPRLGASYDVFGNGKTAVKAFVGRYVFREGVATVERNNPSATVVRSTTRNWTDTNGNFRPDCDLLNPALNLECGALANTNFGKPVPNSRDLPDVLRGWGARPYSSQASVTIQHELRANLGIAAGYYRTWQGNFTVTDNVLITPADFDPFCLTVPRDPRLPGGGGNQLCGLSDIKPAAFGLAQNVVTQAANFGEQIYTYDGFDATLTARFGRGGHFSGGVASGQTVTDNCGALPDSPQNLYCRQVLPFEGQTQWKFNAVYPLPWEMQASAVFQSLAGIPILASYVASNAEVAPTLGRNLGSCRGAAVCNGTVTIPNIVEPNTLFEERLNQLDLRLTKSLRVRRVRMAGTFDAFNVFNAATIVATNNRYGSQWLQPNAVLSGRLLKFGFRADF